MSRGHFGIDPRKNFADIQYIKSQPLGPSIHIPSPSKSKNYYSNYNRNSYGYQKESRGYQSQLRSESSNQKMMQYPPSAVEAERRYELIENMLRNLYAQPRQTAIEQTLLQLLSASNAIVWLNNSNSNILYSPTLSRTCKYQTSIVGLCYRTKKIILVPVPSEHESFNVTIDIEDASTLYIPLLHSNSESGDVFGVAQVFRSSDWLPFTDDDISQANFFARKFSQLSHLFTRSTRDMTFNLNVFGATDKHLVKKLSELLTRQFLCKCTEFWSLDDVSQTFSKFDPESQSFALITSQNVGVVGPLMTSCLIMNSEDSSKLPSYSPEFDGNPGQSILVTPYHVNSQTIAVVLRGKAGNLPFGAIEANQLVSLVPLISKAIVTFGGGVTSDEDMSSTNFALRLKALLEVAEIISGVLDIDALIPTIMQRACQLLNTERCSLFLVDSSKQELISRFHGGLERSIRLPINRGIVGHTAQTGNLVNITDAYNDPRFDKAVDLATGFRTRTILTVPIYNNRGEIGGVTEMINRIDGSAFDEDDIKMMKAFNVFCGISLDNARLYQTSLDLTRQLRGFVEMSTALNKTKTVRDVIEQILDNAKVVIHASRATIFLKESKEEALSPFVNIGQEIVHGTHFAEIVVEQGKTLIFNREEIVEYLQSKSFTDAVESNESLKLCNGLSRISSTLLTDQDIFDSMKDTSMELPQFEPICGFPLLSKTGKCLGVMEMSCTYRILPEDVKLLDCFAVFAAVSLEKAELEDIAKFGKVEMELKKYITDEERKKCQIPEGLIIPPEESSTIFTINFDAPEWAGIGFFKIVFRMFDTFHLLEEFKIPADTFFRFLSQISATYNPVPYHNWRHAVDVTQFISYEMLTGGVQNKLPKFDIFALLTAAVCHDANHDGFSNVFNEKAETPLGILFKNQSVMETHHCSVSIDILSKAENNIFASLSSTEYKRIWTLIIQLILWTDMAKHFDFLKQANAELDNGPLDMEKDEHRLIMMRAILKCADVSNVSRPFELADKWCDVLCEEFFRQGDLEMASGMEYTSPLNDREHLDKPKSQIGFYTFVCLPLFEVAARAVPELVVNCNQIRSNLEVWKKAAAEKEKAAAAEKEKNENAENQGDKKEENEQK